MKTLKMSFLKLLCFKNKLGLLSLDVICILVALILSCILLQYAVVAPSEDVVEVCEVTLYEYLENPLSYSPQKNISIILEENTITVAMQQAFTYLIATRNENQTYQISTYTRFVSFFFSYLFGLIFSIVFLYITIEILLYFLIIGVKFFIGILQKIKLHISKKIWKVKNEFERRQKQKGVKEYEIPRLQEIYQLGYNMGHADGIAEGAKMGKSDLTYQN